MPATGRRPAGDSAGAAGADHQRGLNHSTRPGIEPSLGKVACSQLADAVRSLSE